MTPRQLCATAAAVVCASCVAAEPLTVEILRREIASVEQTHPYEHDIEADLAWMQAMPVLERLAADIVSLEARFLAVESDRWTVPGVPPRLYCLIGPASMRPIPIGEAAGTPTGQALSAQLDTFIVPYNRLLAEYYEAEYGWDCEDAPGIPGQSMP